MKAVEPIFVADLFGEIHEELLTLLRGLSAEDWHKPTVAGSWLVRDIVAHLLDSDIRRLSFQRDQAPMGPPDTPIASYANLVGFLNQLNADWVKAAKRISPPLLIEFLSITGTEVTKLFQSLDPNSPAMFGVAWAGEETSANWFDIAREYTEKWHHQQQIRDAVGAPALYARKWLHPVLDTFMRALPVNYKNTLAASGTQLSFVITGEAGGVWTLVRRTDDWELFAGVTDNVATRIEFDQDTAWRLMTKGLSRDAAAKRMAMTGDINFAEPLLSTLAVMA
jgi:uncharacterized protein (TIGR03083 family)